MITNVPDKSLEGHCCNDRYTDAYLTSTHTLCHDHDIIHLKGISVVIAVSFAS